jgi:hypothetical protein
VERKKIEKEQWVAQQKVRKDEKDKKKAEIEEAAAKKKDAALQKRLTRENQRADQEATKTKIGQPVKQTHARGLTIVPIMALPKKEEFK